MKRKLSFFIPALSILLLAGQAQAGTPAENQLTKIEHNWADAYVKREPAFVQRLTTDDFIFVGPDGKAMNKADYVKEITGDTTFTAFNITDLKIRAYENVGVVTGTATITTKTGDKEETGAYAFTDVFVKRSGEWKAVSGQATQLKPSEPAK